jgi:PAS domain S-box-containing protein
VSFANVGLVEAARPRLPDMPGQIEDPAQETKGLQRCINDLVSVLSLSSIWRGSEPAQIVQTLLDVLLRMLSLDFAYARLNEAFGAMTVEILRIAEDCKLNLSPEELRNILGSLFAVDAQSLPRIRSRLGVEETSIFPVPLGIQGQIGVLVVGSNRVSFPEKTESLLLCVAANQASIGLQETKLLGEQRRIASELEQRVAERTSELAQANEALRKEIAERKRGEAALHEREQSLRLILDGIAGLVTIMSTTGEVEAVNRQVLDYFGKSIEQVKGWSTSDAIHPEDLPGAISAWMHSVETVSLYDVDHRLRRADGVYRWFHARGLPLRDLEGRVLRWYVLLTDIDDRKRAEEELRVAQSELARVMRAMTMGQLTASIAHEVNQPLSGIITNANTCLRMLDANPPNLESARETTRRTIRDGHRAADVITRLRTLYSKKEPALELMDLNEAAREVTALSWTEIQRNGVSLRQELADDLPPALGDRIQLQQVILNLLRNAADAMSTIDNRSRELLVRTERDGNRVRLSVKDSGVGFAPQVADKIFEAFYTSKTDGMGIGLSISRSIIEAHQGRLWATPNDGPGSTFSFSIPCKHEGLADAEIRVSSADPSAGSA